MSSGVDGLEVNSSPSLALRSLEGCFVVKTSAGPGCASGSAQARKSTLATCAPLIWVQTYSPVITRVVFVASHALHRVLFLLSPLLHRQRKFTTLRSVR